MCGISGWVDVKNDISGRHHLVEKMSETMAGRGPDASGIWISPNAVIGHRRLAVVDPAGGGQPMVWRRHNKTYVLTYNGELYNTSELRKELEQRGYSFRSSSDTEVLLVSYIEWGPGCVDRLNGIYAFGVWDESEKTLFLARDRFGVKPLFFSVNGSAIMFGSEPKALLAHPLIKAEVDSEGLAEIFALGPARSPGHGIYKGVREVKPAWCLTFDRDGAHERKYWSLVSHEHKDTPEETVEKLHSLVHDAIVRQLAADVPVCTFLSGGLDSSAITAIASEAFRKSNGQKLHTYSIDYVDNDKYFKASSFQPNSDTPWVKRVSDEYETIHHYITFDTPQLVEALVSATEAKDMPGMADIDSSLWLFCREIKKDATVALSGECADEIFGGYPWFHRPELMFGNTFPWSVNIRERTRVLSGELSDMINPEEYIKRRYIETLAEVPKLNNEDELEARRREIFYLNLTWFMTTLLDRKDRMSMYHGLEVRVPYCDHRLVQYVWNIPWHLKMYDGREKGILRKALTGLLSEDVLWRKKSPFPKTHNPSYEKAVKSWMQDIISDANSPILPLIDVDMIKEMLKEKSDYGKPWFGQLMAAPQMLAFLIQVDIWLKKYKVRIV